MSHTLLPTDVVCLCVAARAEGVSKAAGFLVKAVYEACEYRGTMRDDITIVILDIGAKQEQKLKEQNTFTADVATNDQPKCCIVA